MAPGASSYEHVIVWQKMVNDDPTYWAGESSWMSSLTMVYVQNPCLKCPPNSNSLKGAVGEFNAVLGGQGYAAILPQVQAGKCACNTGYGNSWETSTTAHYAANCLQCPAGKFSEQVTYPTALSWKNNVDKCPSWLYPWSSYTDVFFEFSGTFPDESGGWNHACSLYTNSGVQNDQELQSDGVTYHANSYTSDLMRGGYGASGHDNMQLVSTTCLYCSHAVAKNEHSMWSAGGGGWNTCKCLPGLRLKCTDTINGQFDNEVTCPSTTFQLSLTAYYHCEKCADNTYQSLLQNVVQCTSCATGKYSGQWSRGVAEYEYTTISHDFCYCGFGEYNTVDCSVSQSCTCASCQAGKYTSSASPSLTSCSWCGTAKYQTSTGQSGCLNCPAYSTTLSTGSTALTNCVCNAGYTGSNGGTCTLCAAGKFKSTTGSASCQDCAATYTSNPSRTACYCNVNYFESAGSCLACPLNTAQPSPGQTSCQCNAGFYGTTPTLDTDCTACPQDSQQL